MEIKVSLIIEKSIISMDFYDFFSALENIARKKSHKPSNSYLQILKRKLSELLENE